MPDAASSSPFEAIEVTERIVACDGGGEPLGHPRVYLKIEDRSVTCPYCSRHYMLAAGVAAGTPH